MDRSSGNLNSSEILCLCKYNELIKNEVAMVSTTFSLLQAYGKIFRHSSNYKVKSRIWPEIELVQVFMPALDTCKFAEDLIKNEGATVSTTTCFSL